MLAEQIGLAHHLPQFLRDMRCERIEQCEQGLILCTVDALFGQLVEQRHHLCNGRVHLQIPETYYLDVLKRQAVVNPKLRFIFRNETPEGIKETEFYYENGISDYVTV